MDANVEVAVAQIYGTVNGDITASKRIEMGRVAKVTGNIQTPALVIEQGALFEGSCRMMQLKEQSEAAAASSSSSSSSSASTGASSSGSSKYGSGSSKSSSSGAPASDTSTADVTDATDVAS